MLAGYGKTLLIECHQKWILMMYILNNVTKWPSNCIKNIMVEIRLKIDAWTIPIPYIVAPDCIFTIVVESTLKIGAECIYMYTNWLNCQIWLVQSPNWHCSWICIENWCQMHIHMHQFPKFPNLVSSITKLTLQLDPHWKLMLNAYTYVPITKITKFG